jgi:hypothetical protein
MVTRDHPVDRAEPGAAAGDPAAREPAAPSSAQTEMQAASIVHTIARFIIQDLSATSAGYHLVFSIQLAPKAPA